MPRHGRKSKAFLATCTENIQLVFSQVVRFFDNKILDGARTLEEQSAKVEAGSSKTMNSKHVPRTVTGSYDPNGKSKAVDAAPFPVEWPDVESMNLILAKLSEDEVKVLKKYIKVVGRFYAFHGYVIATSDAMGRPLRGGSDWDKDWDFTDQSFDDLIHFEEEGA